ncbi:SipW-dependent-type signal peptide-containing protein [Micrococcaceae bacterium Sec5.1]
MRIPRSIKTAGLLVAAVLLGLMAVQGTYALWSATAVAQPGTVKASSFTVNLTGSPSGSSVPMTVNDQATTLALTTAQAPLADLVRGSSVYTSIGIGNASDAGGVFDITVTATAPTVSNVSGGTMAGYLTVTAASAASSTACSSASGYQPLTGAGFTTPAIAKGATATLCFKVTLDAAAPSSVEGNSVSITLPLHARQKCGVPNGCAQ